MRTGLIIAALCLLPGLICASNDYDRAIDRIARKVDRTVDRLEKGVLIVDEFHAQGDVICELGNVIANDIESSLIRRRKGYSLLDRSALSESLDLLEVTHDQADISALVQAGRLAKADVLLTGTFGKVGDELVIRARLLDLQSKEVLLSLSGRTVTNKELDGLCGRLSDVAGDILFTDTDFEVAVEEEVDNEPSPLQSTGVIEFLNPNNAAMELSLVKGTEQRDIVVAANSSARLFGLEEGIWRLRTSARNRPQRILSHQEIMVLAHDDNVHEIEEFRKRDLRFRFGFGGLTEGFQLMVNPFREVERVMNESEQLIRESIQEMERSLP